MFIQAMQLFIPTSPCFRTVGIDEVRANQFQIFPNPASEEIMIRSDEDNHIDDVKIFDVNGVPQFVLFEHKTVQLSHLAKGMYFITIVSRGKKEIHRIVKL